MSRVIRVLVVDDSAFVRKVMRQMLTRSPFIEVVGVARDGGEALELVEQLEPDVVTLDLNMPSSDGITFLRAQMERRPVPVIVVSMASKDGQQVIEALEAGAVDVVQKPTGLATERLLEITEELVAKVKVAATMPLRRQQVSVPTSPPPGQATTGRSCIDVVVCGISTGGPQALKYLIPRLPANFPVPMVIVLHMPVGYTELFARSLNDVSALEVREAHAGDVLRSGLVLLAPAGYHLTLRRVEHEVVTHLDLLPLDTVHRPAAESFRVERDDTGRGFVVIGREAERAVALNDLTNPEALVVVHDRLKRLGVDRALARAGAKQGDRVRIGGLAFDYDEGS